MEKNWILIGSIGRPHGVKGWVKVNSYTDPVHNVFNYQPWYLSLNNGEFSPVQLQQKCVKGQTLLVRFSNCETPEAARFFTNNRIFVAREQLSLLAPGEYYWTDLEGLKVYNKEDIYLGIVQTLFSTGSNDVLIVQGDKRYLIPFLLDKIIKSIDLDKKKMLVDWEPDF